MVKLSQNNDRNRLERNCAWWDYYESEGTELCAETTEGLGLNLNMESLIIQAHN